MKFHTKLDAQAFLVEIGKLNEAMGVTEKYVPTDEEMKSFLSQRSGLVRNIKNQRQSSKQKANWRENRYKIMRGIKSFHKSVEGKRFHRKLGRLAATRISKDKRRTEESVLEKYESLNAVASLKQHLVVELGYFHKLYEQVEIEEMIIDNALPMLTEIEKKVLHGTDLNDEELTFIMDMVDNDIFLDELAKLTGESFDNMKKWCEDIKHDLESNGVSQDSPEWHLETIKGLILSSHEKKVTT